MALDRTPVTAAEMEMDEKDGPPKKTPRQIADYYLDAIQSAEKRRKPFIARGKQIIKRYKNKRTLTTLGVPIANRRMNVLWSNVQTMKPVLYALPPKANVSRRNKTKDPVGRVASIVLQNCLQNSLGMEDFSYVMGQVVEDRLLPGAGLAMVEYVPQVEADKVGFQAAETRYLNWQDWVTNPARTWQEVWLFGYKAYLTRKECRDLVLRSSGDQALADDVYKNITLDHREDGKDPDKPGIAGVTEIGPAKATVWCIWDKNEKQVIQVSPGYGEAPLAILPPPVNFDGFFPIPRPYQSSTSNDSVLPVPDFEQYVDQADEIDLLTQRIATLTQALRLRGLYPADMDSLKQLTEAGDADMIPYDQWQLIAERGGAEALVIWFPIEAIAKTLVACIQARDKALDIMRQIIGISDIQRGVTDPQETKGAQELKAQYGNIRTKNDQRDVQRFIKNVLQLKAEVICEHFELKNIKDMSGMKLLSEQEKVMVKQALAMWQQFNQVMQQYQQAAQQAQQAAQQGQPVALPQPPQQPTVPQPSEEMEEALEEPSWEQVMAVLKNEKLRGFVVDVETDSTIEPDQQAQQQAAAQYVAAVAEFLTAALPIMQAEPDSVDFLGELMSWTTRQWKGADTIEGAVDEFIDKMKKKVEQAKEQPPQPSPEVQTAQIKAGAEATKAQAAIQQTQLQAQSDQQELAMKAQIEQMRAAMEQQTAQTQAALEQFKAQLEAKMAMMDHAMSQAEHNRKMEMMDKQAANGAGEAE